MQAAPCEASSERMALPRGEREFVRTQTKPYCERYLLKLGGAGWCCTSLPSVR